MDADLAKYNEVCWALGRCDLHIKRCRYGSARYKELEAEFTILSMRRVQLEEKLHLRLKPKKAG